MLDDRRRIAVIGLGAMARDLRASLKRSGGLFDVAAALVPPDHNLQAESCGDLKIFRNVLELAAWKPSLVVECAGHSAVRDAVPALLRLGIDTVIVSIGSLVDPALLRELEVAVEIGKSRLTVASGAIGGLDVLRAAKLAGLSSVEYTGTKPSSAWRGTCADSLCDLSAISVATVFFEGSAEQASRLFPKNANVTAAVALAGIGFEKTSVTLVADPNGLSNYHQVTANGAFGEFTISLRNEPLPDNPKTSRLAALSVQQAVVRHFEAIEI
jgi:aspartate dehydrogenase